MSPAFPHQTVSRRTALRAGGATSLLAAAGLGGLTACGGSNGGSSSTQMKFMYWGSSFEQKAIADMLKKFASENKGVDVAPTFVPYTSYETKVNTLVASGSAPDIAYLNNVQLYQLAEQDKLVNLFPYLKKYPQLANRLPTSYFWYGKDKLAGTQLAEGVQILWYNKKAFTDAGAKMPPADVAQAWTWDEYVTAAEKTTLDNNGKNATESGFDPKHIKQFGTTSPIGSGFMYALLKSNGADMFDETGTKYIMDSPEAIEVLQNMQDLIYKHRVAPTPAQLGNNAPTTSVQLQTRRIAMLVDGDWTLLDLGQTDLQYGSGVLPKYKTPLTTSGGAAGAIFKGTKHIEQAIELYLYYNDPTHVDLFKDGLWMPLETKYYTEKASIDIWAKGKIYPDNFTSAVIKPTVDHSVVWWAQSVKNSNKITEALQPGFDQISQGKRPAKDVLTELKGKVQPLLQGRWPAANS